MRGFTRRGLSRKPTDDTAPATVPSTATSRTAAAAPGAHESATVVLTRFAPEAPTSDATTVAALAVPSVPIANRTPRPAPVESAPAWPTGTSHQFGASGVTAAAVNPVVAGTANTEVLDVRRAGAVADPGALTEVIGPGPGIGPVVAAGSGPDSGPDSGPSVPPPAPLVSRRVAAEIGVYCGAVLALVAILGVVVRGWSAWDSTLHSAFVALSTSTLVAAGLFLRLPWRQALGDERRRAVSVLLSTGVAVASAGVTAALLADGNPGGAATEAAGSGSGSLAVAAVGAAVAMLAVTVVARTPLAETGLLVALAWAAWVVAPPGPGTWAFLAGLGLLWAGLGYRWARGRRTAVLLGVSLALACSVGMATGPWAWPTRAVLAVAAAVGLGAFLRGRANAWLALGAGAATALAASVAGDVVGPALALLVGGVATMVVSGVALLGTRPR